MKESSSNTVRNGRALGWLYLPAGLALFAALASYDWHAISTLCTPPSPSANWIGALGDNFAYLGYLFVGLAIWLVPALVTAAGLLRVFDRRIHSGWRKLWLLILLVSTACLLQLVTPAAPGLRALLAQINLADAGGVVGYLLAERALLPTVGGGGTYGILLGALAFSLVAILGIDRLRSLAIELWNWARGDRAEAPEPPERDRRADEAEYLAKTAEFLANRRARNDARAQAKAERERNKAEKAAARAQAISRLREAPPRTAVPPPPPAPAPVPASAPAPAPAANGPYTLPGLDLLHPLTRSEADHGDVEEMSQRLIDTLKLFNIDATMSYQVMGPVVTKYAVTLAPGTLYSRVTAIADNLKGALRARSLRIEAPIPGEECVGIEVPNRSPAGISFREIIESAAWRNSKAELPLLFGKDAAGHELVADLAAMPHMLVAGATGQGKSVCLNSIICGLLMSRTPAELKLIMVDPKTVEFTPYASIPHLLVPVITENRKVMFSLKWAVAEMEKRLKLFARAKVRNIYDFNHRSHYTQDDLFGEAASPSSDLPEKIPYIVIIIDEVADLMSTSAKEVTPDIQRLTQKSRAAGIHLILATQRPDAKIITGTIKANIPGRVAFKTSQAIDSRTILDEAGAEKLIGRGDMLFRGKDSVLIRAQGAWIADDEIANITEFIAQQTGPQFDEEFSSKLGRVKEAKNDDPFAGNEDDPDNQTPSGAEAARQQRELLKAKNEADDIQKAIACLVEFKRASTSFFQRQMGWGYNHAATILDQLAARGIVSPAQGMGARQILMSQEELLDVLNAAGDDGSAADAGEPLTPEGAEGGGSSDLDPTQTETALEEPQ